MCQQSIFVVVENWAFFGGNFEETVFLLETVYYISWSILRLGIRLLTFSNWTMFKQILILSLNST